jgi:hypothetical protein
VSPCANHDGKTTWSHGSSAFRYANRTWEDAHVAAAFAFGSVPPVEAAMEKRPCAAASLLTQYPFGSPIEQAKKAP